MTVHCTLMLTTTEKLGAWDFIVVPRIGETIVLPPLAGAQAPEFYKVMLVQHVPQVEGMDATVDLLVEAKV
ncbi:hypothetical protein MKK63_03585 [Methylobacterium sp. J-088]|uniref:hypothetical protein n=1 Tax=unclassified Methylobacterium TaxID=2615210 RepID=UPI001FB8761E|nr:MULTISPECIES: hypothetical protein [unclassified Methylobacterium]MCJ2061784.1 hypothetical protein [Methylobacterium sp. J-088]